MTSHQEHATRLGRLVVRSRLYELLQLGLELSNDRGRVLACQRKSHVKIDERLLEILHFELDVCSQVLAQLLNEREYDGLLKLTLRLFGRAIQRILEDLGRHDQLAQVHEQIEIGRAQSYLKSAIELTFIEKFIENFKEIQKSKNP